MYLGSCYAARNLFAAHASCPAEGLHKEELHEQHELCKNGPNYALLQDAVERFLRLSFLICTWHLARGVSASWHHAICMPKSYLPDSFSYDIDLVGGLRGDGISLVSQDWVYNVDWDAAFRVIDQLHCERPSTWSLVMGLLKIMYQTQHGAR